MMKFLVLVALFAMAAARPQEIQVLRNEAENDGDGNFKSALETSDGVKIQQSGYIKNPSEQDPEKRIQVIEGSFTFLDRETGQPQTVTYVADENGYQPIVNGVKV